MRCMNEKSITEQKLLYDPMFDKTPDVSLPDDPTKGLLGKTAFKKFLFMILLILSIGFSLYWSFRSVSTDKFRYEPNETGYMLYSFRGGESDKVLSVDFVRDENNVPDQSKVVTAVRDYALTCNGYVEFIFISENITDMEHISFYSSSNLMAIIVDENNEHFASVDGVLYKKENGVLTEILLYPVRNGYYRTALALGIDAPTSENDVDKFRTDFAAKEEEIYEEYLNTGTTYVIPDSVENIGQLCFSSCHKKDGDKIIYALEHITIPSSVKRIETMAFFKCESLQEIDIPDSVEFLGSDAFSSCKTLSYLFIPASVKEIGHHAFNNCPGIAQVHMGHTSKEEIELGIQWYPQTSRVFMVSVDILYGQTRGEGADING